LGVHFGPLLQFGPALNGHMPNKSLSIDVSDPDHKDGQHYTPSHRLVNRSMGTITTLKEFLKADKVTWETVHHIFDALGSEGCFERVGFGRGSVSEATTRWNRGVVPTEAVGGRIRAHEIGSEGTGCDLEVI